MELATKRIVIAIAMWLTVLFLTSVLSGSLAVITSGNVVGEWLVPLGTHSGMAVLAMAFILMVRGGDLRRYGFTLGTSISWISLAIWSVLVGGVAAVVAVSLPFPPIPEPFGGNLFESILLVWIYASICEEILVRGMVQGYLEPLREQGVTVAGIRLSLPVILAAILFAIMHVALLTLGAHPVQVLVVQVFAFFLGLIAGYYRERSGSLIPAIAVHSIFNIVGGFVTTVMT